MNDIKTANKIRKKFIKDNPDVKVEVTDEFIKVNNYIAIDYSRYGNDDLANTKVILQKMKESLSLKPGTTKLDKYGHVISEPKTSKIGSLMKFIRGKKK
jgi:hypothetical protein